MTWLFAPSAWCRPASAPTPACRPCWCITEKRYCWRRISIPPASGCRLDLARLQQCGRRVAAALEAGADLLVVNRFGKRERDGKGLLQLIERALDADTPVVIAVSSAHFADWIKFAGGMCVKLTCDRDALDHWWRNVSMRAAEIGSDRQTVCEALK